MFMLVTEMKSTSAKLNCELSRPPVRFQNEQPKTMAALFVSANLDPIDPTQGAAGTYRNPQMELGRTKFPKAAPHEVVIEVIVVSICGSDYHLVTQDAGGRPLSSCPTKGLEIGRGLVLGHEFAGRIINLGSDVEGFQLGELVTADSVIPCRKRFCLACGDSHFNYCPRSELVGFERPGAFAEQIAIPASSVHSLEKLIPTVGRAEAMIIGSQSEPMGVAYHAIQQVLRCWRLGRPPSIRIWGAGPLGLYVAAFVKMLNLGRISVVEPSEKRRALASLFAAEVINPNDPKEMRASVLDSKVDVAFDCFGVPCLKSLLGQMNPGGSVVLLARRGQELTLHVDKLMTQGLHVMGVRGHIGFVPHVVDLLAQGRIDPRPLITTQLTGFDSLLSWLKQPDKFMREGKVICHLNQTKD